MSLSLLLRRISLLHISTEIFDNEKFTRRFLNNVRVKKGLELLEESFSFTEFKEREYDRLAKLLRENLDIDEIYNMMK